jgi:hypothetical protein
MLKRLHQAAVAPQRITTTEEIRAAIQESIVDVNSIVAQWNETLQPLIDSLPGGRRRVSSGARSAEVNPVSNGFDGSQIFTDSTATAQTLGGFLYNGRAKRPKTIKETIIDANASVQSEVSKLRVLIDGLEAASSSYDDTELRNWIRRLAGDTISDLDQGETFLTGYFGEPTKTAQYSLHQRDANLRQLIGIESDDYGAVDPGFSGTNHIDDLTVLEALIELDGLVGSGSGVSNLQEAYDGGGSITTESGSPVTFATVDGDLLAPLKTISANATTGGLAHQLIGTAAFYHNAANLVGVLGALGASTQFVVRQYASNISLKLGLEGGYSTYFGTWQDFDLYSNGETGWAELVSSGGIRFKSSASSQNLGSVGIFQALIEDENRASMEEGCIGVFGTVAVAGRSPKGDFLWVDDVVISEADHFFENDVGLYEHRRTAGGIVPSPYAIYKDTVVKAVFTGKRDGTATQWQNSVYFTDADMFALSNVIIAPNGTEEVVAIDDAEFCALTSGGVGRVLFQTSLPNGQYTVSASVETADGAGEYVVTIFDRTAGGFKYKIKKWTGSGFGFTDTDILTIHFQVI